LCNPKCDVAMPASTAGMPVAIPASPTGRRRRRRTTG
jgi:hypothetical protein